MKNMLRLAAAGTALLGLAAADSRAGTLRAVPPVGLPPVLTASRVYRCVDNRLYYVDYFSNNIAMLRIGRNGVPVRLVSRGAGRPYSGAGYWIAGSGDQIRLAVGRRRLLCRG